MGAVKQLIKWVSGGLNSDDSSRIFGLGDSSVRINVSTNELGREFVISNMKGTVRRSHSFEHDSSYSDAVYAAIGSCYDDDRDAVYIFIHSSADNHCILRFNYSDDSFDKIVWDNENLGLDTDYPIADAYMIGDFLHWNPRTSSPRVINVQWAYYDHVAWMATPYTAGTYDLGAYVKVRNKVYRTLTDTVDYDWSNALGNVEFVDWTYSDIYTPPDGDGTYHYRDRYFYNTPYQPYNKAPYTELTSDTDYTANYIRGNTFQFCYRFHVPKQGYCISSPFSDIVVNANDESLSGEVVGDVQENNVIKVGFNIGGDSAEVDLFYTIMLADFVDILFRKNADTQWYVAERVYHVDYVSLIDVRNITVDFYNDRNYEVVDSAAIEKQYNGLPLLARSQWALDGLRAAYGGVTEGFDALDNMDVELTSNFNTVQLNDGGAPATLLDTETFSAESVELDPERPDITTYEYTTDPVTALPGGSNPLHIIFTFDGVEYTGSHSPASASEYRTAIVDTVSTAPGVSAWVTGSNEIQFLYDQYKSAEVTVYDTPASTYAVTKYSSFKTNAEHPFCIYYYDELMRRSEPMVQSNNSSGKGTTVFVPALPDEGSITSGTNKQQYVIWEVDHQAPSWAKFWRWGYAGNRSVSLFWQYNINGVSIGTAPENLTMYALVDISSLQTITDPDAGNDHVHINSNISSYVFEEGDRIKFITQEEGGSGLNTTNMLIADDGYDYEIKGFDDVNHLIYLDATALGGTPYTGYDTDEVVVEIYRPKNNEALEFFEYGSLFSVTESSGKYYHSGSTQDQTASLPALGFHNAGDVFLISREVANTPSTFTGSDGPIFMESYHWSDFYDSDNWGRGKFGNVSRIGQVYLDNVRYGNRYSPNTVSSGLSEFDFGDYKSLSSENGKITAMRQAGHVLKVYFERNSASVMVNKTQLLDADGISQVVKSDDVLGTVEYSNYHYGTIFPESVILIDRTIYFYDIYRKAYVRDSANGLFAISDYKYITKFSEKSDALLASGVGNIEVWTAYDPERHYVYVMFKDSATPANDETLIFNEKRNKWETAVELKEDVFFTPSVRNEDLTYGLPTAVETVIAVDTVTSGFPAYITFNNLPDELYEDLKSTTGQSTVFVNLDAFDTGGYTATTGDYDLITIIDYDSDNDRFQYVNLEGGPPNIGDQMMFYDIYKLFPTVYDTGDNMINGSGQSTYTEFRAGGMFIDSVTYKMFVTSYDNQTGFWTILSASSTDPSSSWTTSFSRVVDPTQFSISGVANSDDATTYGNAVYLEDEDRYLIPVAVQVSAAWHVCLFKCDADFGNATYYTDVITLSEDSLDPKPSMVLYNGEYYLFWTEWDGISLDTSQSVFKYAKASSYTGFSSSDHETIYEGTTSSDTTSTIDNRWYNAYVDGCTPFVHHNMLYLFVNGVSRYDISGNRNVKMTGLFEFGGVDFKMSKYGVVWPGTWSNYGWDGREVSAPPTFVVNDGVYITSMTQKYVVDAIGFGEMDIDSMFDSEEAIDSSLPSCIRSTARDLISFIGEDLYIHNASDARGYFYNSIKKMVLDVIANPSPEFTKVFDSISLNTNDGTWDITSIDIPATPSYPRGMFSKILNAIFKKRENGLHAEFLRNMKTSSSTASLLELRNGEELRGQTATIKLENSETDEVLLFDIIVNMSPSKI